MRTIGVGIHVKILDSVNKHCMIVICIVFIRKFLGDRKGHLRYSNENTYRKYEYRYIKEIVKC